MLGRAPGRGFAQMMDGIEVGRVNVAARAAGIAIRAFELAIGYAQQRKTFGVAIADHQAIASKEYEIERLMREALFLLIGEGTSEIQKTIISRGLLREYRLG